MTSTTNEPSLERGRRELRGEVVSDAMDATVVVRVTRFVRHPRYGKYVSPSKKYKAHDPNNVCRVGDMVTIREAKPMSKDKRFAVVARQPIEEARRSAVGTESAATAEGNEASEV
jgi:small subunit ribosomal protein S17